VVCANIHRAQEALGRAMLIENPQAIWSWKAR
jgi:uncharacterized protein (UPF0276 family)